MSNTTKIDDTIQKLDALIEKEADPKRRQEMLNDMQSLFAERDSINAQGSAQTPATEQDAEIEKLRAAKGDLRGFASALVSGINRGAVSLVNLPFDIVNLALSAVGAPEEIRTATPTQAADWLSEQLTGFRPIETATTPSAAVDTPAERMLGTFAEYASGGFTGAKLAKEVAERALLKQAPVAGPGGVRQSLMQTTTQPNYITREVAAATGAGLAAAPTREYTNNVYLETLASLVGGVTPDLAVAAFPSIASQAKQFTREGAELRVANELTENAVDLEQAIDNLARNRLIVEQALPEGQSIDAARLTEDPGIMRVIGAAAENDATIYGILSRSQDEVSEGVFNELEALGGGDTSGFLDTVNAKTVDVLDRIALDIDVAKNQASKLEQSIPPGKSGSEISQDFVSSLEASWERAKSYERKLWSLVDKNVKLDAKRFRVLAKRLRRSLKSTAILSPSELDSVFAEINRFGAKGPTGYNTFESLMNYRSRLLEQQRAARSAGEMKKAATLGKLNDLVMEFIDSGPDSSQYAAAAEVTRTLHQNYNKGKLGRYLGLDPQGDTRIDPEAALSRIVRTGDNVGEVRRVIEAEQRQVLESGAEIPPAEGLTQSVKDMLYLKFSEADTPEKRRTFFSNKGYGQTLEKFPELARDLQAIDRELETLAEVIAVSEGRAATIQDKKKVATAALIGADPENIYASFKGLKKEDIVNINNVAIQEGVESGLQAVFMREIADRLILQGDDNFIGSLQNILGSPNNRPLAYGYSVVLTPAQKNALALLDKTNKLVKQNLGKTQGASWLTDASTAAQVISRMLGVRLASAIAPSGPASLQTASLFSRVSSRFINSLPSSQRRKILIDALVDPVMFDKLLKLEKSTLPLEQKVGELTTLFRRSGIRAAEQLSRISEEEKRKQEQQ